MDVSQQTEQAKFSELLSDGPILARLGELGFTTPTDIQCLALPKALEGKDIIVRAKTGSGKTLAFVIPLLEKLSKKEASLDSTIALFVAPTRELALQIQDVVEQLNPNLSPALIIGGVDEKKQQAALNKDPRIIVGTPGRLLDLLKRKVYNLKSCRYFVLDEADEMLSMGFIEDVRAILSRLPKQRQGLFVSATITPRVEMLAHSFLSKSEFVHVEEEEDEAPAIDHLYCEVGGDLLAKPHALCDIIETQRPRSAIIFCNTKSDTELVEVLLRRRGFDARRMNSDLSQSQRQKVIAKIKSEELQLLVATDIAARGIDIEQLDLVINYSLHDQSDTYIHRSGRTGRAGLAGRAISLVGPRDFGAFHHLTKILDVDFQKMELPTDEEVADARVAHLYETLRTNESKVDERAQLSAKKLLRDHGAESEASEDLIEILARLCDFTIAHAVAEEAKSLDEELSAESNSKERGKGRDKRDDYNDEKRGSKRRDSKQGSREDKPREPRERREKSSKRPEEQERIRLYVGQGSSHGMSESAFKELAQNLAEVGEKEIHRVSVREYYSYVDTSNQAAEKMLANLAGIEHNEASLPVEIATKISAPRRKNPSNRGRNSQGRSRGNGRSRGSDRN